jgi:hypothetical protein
MVKYMTTVRFIPLTLDYNKLYFLAHFPYKANQHILTASHIMTLRLSL